MPGRNDPCPCGSGKKFKKCCLGKQVVVRRQPPKTMRLQPGVTQEMANAYHEAGHVVFAELIGPGVDIVTIDPQKVAELTGHEYPGYTRYAGPEGQKAEFMGPHVYDPCRTNVRGRVCHEWNDFYKGK